MPILIVGPDGAENEFPDGTPDDVIESAMRAQYGGPEPEPAAPKGDTLFNNNITRGVARLPELARTDARGAQARKEFGQGAGEALAATGRGVASLGGPAVDYLTAGAAKLAGNENSYVDLVEQSKQYGRDMAKERPLMTLAGQAYGGVRAAGALNRAGVTGAGAQGAIVAAAPAVLNEAEEAARTGSISGEDVGGVATTAAVGAVGGKVGEKVGKIVSQYANPLAALAGRLKGADGRKLRTEDLERAFAEAQAAVGPNHRPSLVEVVRAAQIKPLERLAETRKGANQAFIDARDARLANNPARLQNQVTQGRNVATADEMTAIRDAEMNAAMDPIKQSAAEIDQSVAAVALDRANGIKLPESLRGRLAEAASQGRPASVTVEEADYIRQALADAPNLQPVRLARERIVEDVSRSVPGYRPALSEYRAGSEVIEGAAAAQREVLGSTTPLAVSEAAARRTANQALGAEVGSVVAVSQKAGSSAANARAVARQLQEPGVQSKLATNINPAEAARLGVVGRVAQQGDENLDTLARSKLDEIITTNDAGDTIARLAEIAPRQNKALGVVQAVGSMADAALGVLRGLGLPPGAGRRIAELATEPGGAERVVEFLRRSRVSPARTEEIMKALGATVFRDQPDGTLEAAAEAAN